MIQVTISNLQAVQIAGAQWPDQVSADKWIAGEVATNSWGKPDRWLTPSPIDGSIPGEDVKLSDATRVVTDKTSGQSHTELHFPAQYLIVATDITAQLAAAKAAADALASALAAKKAAALPALNKGAARTPAEMNLLLDLIIATLGIT